MLSLLGENRVGFIILCAITMYCLAVAITETVLDYKLKTEAPPYTLLSTQYTRSDGISGLRTGTLNPSEVGDGLSLAKLTKISYYSVGGPYVAAMTSDDRDVSDFAPDFVKDSWRKNPSPLTKEFYAIVRKIKPTVKEDYKQLVQLDNEIMTIINNNTSKISDLNLWKRSPKDLVNYSDSQIAAMSKSLCRKLSARNKIPHEININQHELSLWLFSNHKNSLDLEYGPQYSLRDSLPYGIIWALAVVMSIVGFLTFRSNWKSWIVYMALISFVAIAIRWGSFFAYRYGGAFLREGMPTYPAPNPLGCWIIAVILLFILAHKCWNLTRIEPVSAG